MPRSFDLTVESPNAAERIHATFRDETYWRARLLRFNDGGPTLDSLTTDADGITTVTMTSHFGVEQLPPPMNRLHRGSLRIVEVATWHASVDGTLHGKITVDAPGAPVSGHGELTVTRVAGGSRFAGRGTVDVRVPVIGGPIAAFVAGQLASGIRDIHEFTDAWMAENCRR
ncbi:MAG: DUF2505 domain-containing protein [Mycobacterium sp.]